MDTPEFERLRRIKQLGLAHYIYPSATHTRFEHCLGVMHLAGELLKEISDSVTPRERELVQLAGLLHDVGHVAFSHLFDYILEEKNLNPGLHHHEDRSVFILKQINQRKNLLTPREVEMISKMIHGDTTGEEKPFLFEIVCNDAFGLDVDRLDYLQRDLYHTGSPCFQADYVLTCIRVKHGHLSVLQKARPEIEMMYESRKRLLMLICRHKTVMKIEYLIRKAVHELKLTGEWFEQNWLRLDDFLVTCKMYETCPDIMHKVDTRDWTGVEPEDGSTNMKYITRDSIEGQLDKVNWYN
jgi:HD superfamily phosphohydrolase